MKNFSKILILLIGINFIQGKINSQIKNDEKTLDDISKYYQKLIANHILDIVIKFPTNCKNQLFFICTLNFINSFKNITKMVDRFGEKNLNGALYTLLPLLEDYKLKKFNVTVSKVIIRLLPKEIKIKEGDYRLKGIYGPYGEYGFRGPYKPDGPFKDYLSKIDVFEFDKEKTENELYGRKLYDEGYIDLKPICRFILWFFDAEDDCER